MDGWLLKRGTVERAIPDEITLVKWAAEKRFKASDLIYHPTLQRWLYAREVEEIRFAFQPVPGTIQSTNIVSPPAPSLFWAWGSGSRVVGILGGLVAVIAGIVLLRLKAAGENSLIEAMAHGFGVYCLGKGLFMVAIMLNAQEAVRYLTHTGLRRRDERAPVPSALPEEPNTTLSTERQPL